MPDVLTEAGVSWKCYNPYGPDYQPGAGIFISKNMLLYFDQYANADPSSPAYQNAFSYYGPNVNGGLTLDEPETRRLHRGRRQRDPPSGVVDHLPRLL